MKSIIAFPFTLALLCIILSQSCAAIETDAGHDTLITLLTDKIGIPTEYIEEVDRFEELDAINFNTKNSSVFVIIDFENNQVSVGGRLPEKRTKMSVWKNLSTEAIFDVGFFVLRNYKEINSKSKERFAYLIYDNENSLYIDTVAEANSGIKKYETIFIRKVPGRTISVKTVTPRATAIPRTPNPTQRTKTVTKTEKQSVLSTIIIIGVGLILFSALVGGGGGKKRTGKQLTRLSASDVRRFKKGKPYNNAYEYEKYVAYWLATRGFKNIRITPKSGDYGADILCVNKKGASYAVQCKYYKRPVGYRAVEEVLGAMHYYNCSGAMVVTNSNFTRQAIEAAQRTGVKLLGNVW